MGKLQWGMIIVSVIFLSLFACADIKDANAIPVILLLESETTSTTTISIPDLVKDFLSNGGYSLQNGATLVTDPTHGQVLSVDGTNYAEVSFDSDHNPAQFTVTAWVYPTDHASYGYGSVFTSRQDPPQSGYMLYKTPGNIWQFWTGTAGGWEAISSTSPVIDDQWVHLAVTYDGDKQSLYINGTLEASKTGVTVQLNTSKPLRIGAGQTETTADYFFKGKIAKVRLYNRPLTQSEIQQDSTL